MNEMVERAAIAIWDENQKLRPEGEPRYSWAEGSDANRVTFKGIARAAIAAMREPTDEMIRAGSKCDTAHTWKFMIDEALR